MNLILNGGQWRINKNHAWKSIPSNHINHFKLFQVNIIIQWTAVHQSNLPQIQSLMIIIESIREVSKNFVKHTMNIESTITCTENKVGKRNLLIADKNYYIDYYWLQLQNTMHIPFVGWMLFTDNGHRPIEPFYLVYTIHYTYSCAIDNFRLFVIKAFALISVVGRLNAQRTVKNS